MSRRRGRECRGWTGPQFAPFAALTGYEEVIDETARLAEDKALREDTEPV